MIEKIIALEGLIKVCLSQVKLTLARAILTSLDWNKIESNIALKLLMLLPAMFQCGGRYVFVIEIKVFKTQLICFCYILQ